MLADILGVDIWLVRWQGARTAKKSRPFNTASWLQLRFTAISAKPESHPPAPQPLAASRQLPTWHCLILRQPPKPCAKLVAGKA